MDFYFYGEKIDISENFHVWLFFFHAQKNKLRIYTRSRAISKPVDDVVQIIFQHTCSTSDGSFSSFRSKKVHKFSIETQFLIVFFPLTPKNRDGRRR